MTLSSLLEPLTEFRGLNEAEVLKALAELDATNPVAAEAMRLIAGYAANLQALHINKVRWPIEAVAMRLILKARADALNWPELSMKPRSIVKRALRPPNLHRKARPIKKQRDASS